VSSALASKQAKADTFGFGSGEILVEAEQAGPGQQVIRDAAAVSHAVLIAKSTDGKLATPVSLAEKSIFLGRLRPPLKRSEIRDAGIGLMGDEQLESCPSASLNGSQARRWGSSRRAMARRLPASCSDRHGQ